MPLLATDYLPINRGGTVGDGSTGTYYIGTIQQVLDLIVEVSADAGNLITAGTDGGAFLNQAVIQANETTTSLSYNAGTTTLTYTDEDGGVSNLDLSALTTDIYVTGASIAAGVITFTDNDAGTPDFTLDISTFYNSVTDNQASGTLTLTTSGGTATVVQKTSWMSASAAP